MELDLSTKQLLADLLAEPTLVTQAHADMLAGLVKSYPYYQPLHLLLAKANVGMFQSNDSLATAALYTNGGLLHQVIYKPESLVSRKLTLVSAPSLNQEQIETPEDLEPISVEAILTDEQETFDEITELDVIPIADEQEIIQEIIEPEADLTKVAKTDEQETFDEIAEIDSTVFSSPLVEVEENTENEAGLNEVTVDSVPDELAIERIVATDFFAFEKSFSTAEQEEPKAEKITVLQPEEYNMEAEAQTVSKYDDDKLPYTFLWWLAKTRKEHEQIFQPYVTQKKATNTNPGELQQQYVEHIFHIQTPFNVAEEATKGPLNRQVIPKEIDIIDSFIKNDPQIKAPKAEQINNENKAKKSAEDNYDLVSETLAAIYIEQMLYHKAIDTYEKLSLKFPEKSRYFADLIQSLEKKI